MKTSIVESQVRALQYPQCGDSLAVKYDDFIKHHIFGTFEAFGQDVHAYAAEDGSR